MRTFDLCLVTVGSIYETGFKSINLFNEYLSQGICSKSHRVEGKEKQSNQKTTIRRLTIRRLTNCRKFIKDEQKRNGKYIHDDIAVLTKFHLH